MTCDLSHVIGVKEGCFVATNMFSFLNFFFYREVFDVSLIVIFCRSSDFGKGKKVVPSSDWFRFMLSSAIRCVFSLSNINSVKFLQRF